MSHSNDTCDNCHRQVEVDEVLVDAMTYQGPMRVCVDCYSSFFADEEDAIKSGMDEDEFREND